MPRLQELLEEIKRLENELAAELQKKEEEFFYSIRGKKVYFEQATRQYHKSLVTGVHTYLLNADMLNILSAPVIWSCLIPALLLDLAVTIYQWVCFPIYHIPKVRRDDYLVIDRHALTYLNAIEKLNCVYCGYVNGLIAYVQEIGGRTEQYWCPIKHARKIRTLHSRYAKFVEFGDAETYRASLAKIRADFDDLKEEQAPPASANQENKE